MTYPEASGKLEPGSRQRPSFRFVWLFFFFVLLSFDFVLSLTSLLVVRYRSEALGI